MDRSLQERLVGAAVLVALGVWLIPWVLDGSAVSEPPQDEQVALRLPVPEQTQRVPIRRETIELKADRSALQRNDAPAEQRSAAAALKQPETTSQPEAVLERPAGPVAGVTEKPDPTDGELPGPQLPAETIAKQAGGGRSSPAPQRNEAEAASDILSASPVAGWMVQLGSFSDAGNARRQAQRIGTYGHQAQIYRFAAGGGRTMFRVRLGPVETRERAEAAASELAAQGFVAQLVAPE